jgi:hypothetical protein
LASDFHERGVNSTGQGHGIVLSSLQEVDLAPLLGSEALEDLGPYVLTEPRPDVVEARL